VGGDHSPASRRHPGLTYYCIHVYVHPPADLRVDVNFALASSTFRECQLFEGPMVTPVGRCLCHESVSSARDCCCLGSQRSVSTTDGNGDGDGSDDEMKKLVREKMKTTTLLHQEHGRVPGGGAHLRNGQVPSRSAQLRGSSVPKGVARSKNGRVSKGVGHLRIGRVLVGTAPLRKKNHLASVSGEASTSGDRGGSDPGDSPVTDLVTNLAAHDIIDAIEVAAPRPVGDEVVDDVVIEEIVDSGGDGKDVDEIVPRATVDFGVDGDPIVLEVLSPAEYRNLVFNVFLYLPQVDADY
jgi:hypothetical protein